jgi:hypothetical protein
MEFLFAQMARVLKPLSIEKKILFSVLLYQLLTGILAAYSSIDVMIPCIFKTVFHIECWGCGLSRAAIDVVLLRWNSAYAQHPLVFLIIGLVGFVLFKTQLQKVFRKKISHRFHRIHF